MKGSSHFQVHISGNKHVPFLCPSSQTLQILSPLQNTVLELFSRGTQSPRGHFFSLEPSWEEELDFSRFCLVESFSSVDLFQNGMQNPSFPSPQCFSKHFGLQPIITNAFCKQTQRAYTQLQLKFHKTIPDYMSDRYLVG